MVIAVHNGAAYLRDALDSVAAQHYPQLEVIVVDDGSSDGSAVIAASHTLNPKVVSQEPRGQAAALNKGLNLATGGFLAFLDHDDVWPAGRLREMLAVLSEDTEADGVYGTVVNTDHNLKPIQPPTAVQLAGAMLLRRAAARRVGEFRTDVTHAAIVDWVSRARAARLNLLALDRVVLLRRIHGDNLGIRGRDEARGDLLRVVRDHLRRNR